MSGFVIEYHRPTGARRVQEYAGPNGPREAMLRRLELEQERSDPNWEIASLNSDSLDSLKKTHARYFAEDEI